MKPQEIIRKSIESVLSSLKIPMSDFSIEHPADESHGDYATNVAMVCYRRMAEATESHVPGGDKSGIIYAHGKDDLWHNPRELANRVVEHLKNNSDLVKVVDVERIEVAGPGFINFWLRKEWLVEELDRVISEKEKYGRGGWLKDKKVVVEFTDPNPFKEFHIGHLMSNAIGESIARLLEFAGADLRRVCYQGDVGLHIAKSIWGLKKLMAEKEWQLGDIEKKDLTERAKILGKAYAVGSKAYEEEDNKKEIDDLNRMIYEKSDGETNQMYEIGRQWSLDYFETIYQKLGTKFNHYFFESDAGKRGIDLVREYKDKGVFKESQGAIIFKGEDYGLHTRVFVNSAGLPTYEAKELGLAKAKHEIFPYDWSIVVTGNEINEYFRVLLKALSLIYPDLAEKTSHVSHGMLRLTTGKMSSRTGSVISGESLLDEVEGEIKSKVGKNTDINEVDTLAVTVAAIKYSMLKQGPGKDIIFDFKTSLSTEGDSGPYLLYTYARSGAILKKSQKQLADSVKTDLTDEEMKIVRLLYQFGEIGEMAGRQLQPNLVVSFLTELAQRFNGFYNKEQVIGSDREDFRLLLTTAVNQVLKNGLNLLGIRVVERM